MVMTDPIADMLTRIRNANAAQHDEVLIPASKMKANVLDILVEEGFVKGYEKEEDEKQGMLRVTLKYGANNEKVITGIKRISKPGLRIYAKSAELPRVLGGLGVAIISTSKGVMSNRQAKAEGLGGEVIAYVW